MKKVSFSIAAADAKQVYLVGEFNNWKPGAHPMKKDGKGKWKKQLQLAEGTFEYKFLVDDQWVADPENLKSCPNCFGSQNSIVHVGSGK